MVLARAEPRGWASLFLATAAGAWRSVYVVGVATALYLDVFVGIVQAFLRVPRLRAAAPQQTEAPFVIAQLATLALFVALTVTVAAARRFRSAR